MLASLKKDDPASKLTRYQIGVWLLTFFVYIVYHMTRKTYSVVKSTLNPGENDVEPGFAPFIGSDGKKLLGALDTVFLSVYAVCLFFAGHIGDRSNLRVFIPIGLIGCAVGLLLWPLAYMLDIHNFGFFVIANIISGAFQATGWPSVVCIMSRWFPKGKRGLIMGVWNAHTSIGNMLGSLVGAGMIKFTMDGNGWPWAFAVPSFISIGMAVVCGSLLVPHPAEVGLVVGPIEDDAIPAPDAVDALLPPHHLSSEESTAIPALTAPAATIQQVLDEPEPVAPVDAPEPVTFFTALLIPGVVEFSMALFFCKLVAYTFLFWLPYYLTSFYDSGMASYLSIYFDMGGIVGGIVAGLLADRLKKPALISVCAMVLCMPVLLAYRMVSEQAIGGVAGNIAMMFVLGAFVNGPYALITTAVSADLGSHPMLGTDASALATVSGIVDGMGTTGAAVQGVLVSFVSSIDSPEGKNWNAVFYMLISCCGLAACCLMRLVSREVKEIIASRQGRHRGLSSAGDKAGLLDVDMEGPDGSIVM